MTGTQHSDTDDITIELTKDHNEVREIFAKLRAGVQGDEREALVAEMSTELVKHSVAEEMYLYPVVREVLPGGDAIADKEIEEHAEVEKALKALESVEPSDAAFEHLIQQVIADVTKHAREEEDELFTQLRAQCSAERLHELGDKVRVVKQVSPTRPHPSAPNTPPANKVLGPIAGLVDRVRDAMAR